MLLAAPALARAKDAREVFNVSERTTPSIVQGPTDEQSTQFSVVHLRELTVMATVLHPDGTEFLPVKNENIAPGRHHQALSNFYFSGLELGIEYSLRITNFESGAVLDERLFSTLDLNSNDIRFAVCSCMDHERHEPEIWRDLVRRQPDVIFFIGDTVYADRGATSKKGANPTELWSKFCSARSTLEIYFSKRLIPILATWDDHDMGKNDEGQAYPYITESQANFAAFFLRNPQFCAGLNRGPGISMSLTVGGHLFLLMDGRSFRATAGSKDRYGYWGEEQERWAMDGMRAHSGPVWILSGSQCFPQMPFKESFSGDFKENFGQLLKELQRIENRVVFVSGDVHFSEVSELSDKELGYRSYEITSSSVHSRSVPGAPIIIPNDRRMTATAERNYNLIDATAVGQGVELSLKCCSKNGEVNYSHELKI